VYAYALRRTDPASAQDVVSETFLTAWRRRADLPRDELPWLLATARLVLAKHVRSQRRRDALARVFAERALAVPSRRQPITSCSTRSPRCEAQRRGAGSSGSASGSSSSNATSSARRRGGASPLAA
jgi:DNA-directed RNA polymerase specialized sigma24 family protein